MTAESVPVNHITLTGRLSQPAEFRALPSGDVLATFRLTVDRPAGDRVRVDSIDCTATHGRVRKTLERARAGDVLAVTGSLRRRFWRAPNGPASRYAVDVATARITARAASTADRAADA